MKAANIAAPVKSKAPHIIVGPVNHDEAHGYTFTNEFNVEFLNEGTGPVVPSGTKVTVHYTGKLLDGTVFDSSVSRNKPFEFVVGTGHVIKCWDQGVTQMKKGQKAILTCPPDYAYGDRGAGKVIPPNATLIFEVEVLDF